SRARSAVRGPCGVRFHLRESEDRDEPGRTTGRRAARSRRWPSVARSSEYDGSIPARNSVMSSFPPPQRRLRRVAHHGRFPGGIPHDLQIDPVHRGGSVERTVNRVVEVRTEWAPGGCHGHANADSAITDQEAVDQPEVDDVDAEFRVD